MLAGESVVVSHLIGLGISKRNQPELSDLPDILLLLSVGTCV